MRSLPDRAAIRRALPGTVPFSPEHWHAGLVPGVRVADLEAA